jgi:hypothetical protein
MAYFCRFCRLRRDGLPGGNNPPPPGDKHGPKTRPSSSWGCAAAVFACAFGHAVVLWGSVLGGALPSAAATPSAGAGREHEQGEHEQGEHEQGEQEQGDLVRRLSSTPALATSN